MGGTRTSLIGKRILLTGGTTGIGREKLMLLAAAGARLLTFGRDPDAMNEAVKAADGEVHAIVADAGTRGGSPASIRRSTTSSAASTCWWPAPGWARSRSTKWPMTTGAT